MDDNPTAGKSTRKTWIAILIASLLIIFIICVALVAGGALFIHRHINSQITSAESAEAEFATTRARFSGQQPLIEMRRGDEPVTHRDESAPRRDVQALHVLAYDDRAHKIVHVDVPGWLLRLTSAHGSIRLANLDMFDDDRDRLTLEDLERHGPGLVLDTKQPNGTQVIIWTE